MKKTLTALAMIALLPAGAALADDDCHSPRNQWQTPAAAMRVAQQHGWTVHEFEVDDGCYEIEGYDRHGREVEAKLDPATLQIVELDYDDDDDRRRPSRTGAPAGTIGTTLHDLFRN